MKKAIYIFITLLFSLTIVGQIKTDEKQRELAFYHAINKWFSAWKLVSKDLYKIDNVKPVDFVFFDDKYIYSTSNVTIEKGIEVKGCNLINLKLNWKKSLHNDLLTLPDKSVVPINLMSFAAEIPTDSNKSFFVMPLPSFWLNSGVTSKELGTENLITGVFIHEFSHSQQMQNFGKKITEFEKFNDFGVEFNDDIVQNIFEKDSTYLKCYKNEIDLLYRSIKSNSINKQSVKKGLALMKQRQEKYFKGDYKNLNQIEDFFLTMEGLGQYSMYLWLINPNGGNVNKEIAIQGVRRGGKWWSQDEGFALFLILDKLNNPKNWAKNMFGSKTENIVEMINKLINK
jgi:hypothetical protein